VEGVFTKVPNWFYENPKKSMRLLISGKTSILKGNQ